MNYKHLLEVLKDNTKKFTSKEAIFYKDEVLKSWKGVSWNSFYHQIQQVSKGLINFGIKEQDNIGVFAQNMTEWIIADLGIMGVRAVTIPIYATNSQKEVEYVVNDAEISVLFVGDQEEFDKVEQISEENKFLKLIVVLTETVDIKNHKNAVYFNDFINADYPKSIETTLEKRHSESDLNDLASIIYTSGTTGEPKGVMLDHTNFAASLKVHEAELDVNENDVSLSFLPLSHIYERSWVFFCLQQGIQVYFNQDPKKIADTLKEVKPTLMCTVPRIFEKIFTAIQEKEKKLLLLK
ncbi:AMP-binding protein [Polaribacter sp. L3A8]|uniref:AMP-binding protein n=1 Tax=Polaribacter sp. L3A8 TaxID=2686361 RepID=UPI001E43BA4D|nr:AMP-binding protein [Polaribacter sp. L3A8]